MRKYIKNAVLLFLLLCSCNGNNIQDSLLKSYNIEKAYDTKPIDIRIDSVSNDISLIRLETSDEILIQQITKIYQIGRAHV